MEMELGSIYCAPELSSLLAVHHLQPLHSAGDSVPACGAGLPASALPSRAEMKTGRAITIFNLTALLLLLLHSGMATTPAAAEVDVQRYTNGIGMWVCTVLARPGPIEKEICDWMCRLSNNSTDGGLQVRVGDDYDCCNRGCRCSFCVSVHTVGSAGHGMRAAAAAALWPVALSSLLVLVVMLV